MNSHQVRHLQTRKTFKNVARICKIKGQGCQGFHLYEKTTSRSPTNTSNCAFSEPNLLPNHTKITPNFRLQFCDVLDHILARIGFAFCSRFGPGRTHLAPKGLPSGPKRHQEAARPQGIAMEGTKGPRGPRGLQGVHNAIFA